MIKNINSLGHTILYTVKTSTLKEGRITCVEEERIKVRDFVRNIQFIDQYGNKMGRDDYIEEVVSTKYYENGDYAECNLVDK
jgi:hypothetical protein